MNLAQLQAEAREIATRQAARLQSALDANRDLTPEEETADASDASRLAELQASIARATALQQRLSTASAIALAPAAAAPPARTASPLAEPQPRNNASGFRNLAEFGTAVRLANPAAGNAFRMDERLAAPTNVVMETGDAAGSYLVPAEFRDEIIRLVYDDGGSDPILDLIAPKPTASNRVGGIGSETTPWGTGGVQARWRVEGEQMTPSRTGLKPREVKLNEVYAFVLATEEVLEDAPRLQYLLTNESAAAIRWKVGDAFMNADGIEKPLGWLASDALVTVAKETGQAADSVVRQNVGKMFARMINPGQAVWLGNSDIMPSIMDLKTDLGQPVWFPNYQEAPGGTLLGRPVYFTEHAQTIGDLGDLQFVNPNGYDAYRKQNGVTFADSIHLYFDYNIRAFRWIFRVGGQPLLSAPVAPANGSNSKSHFVALAARA
ncbi:MAG: phage major capsid protein [Caulobacter sp.]|nr:phage major capsid protein [Caulobacter sp.]